MIGDFLSVRWQAAAVDTGPLHISESSAGAIGQFSWRDAADEPAAGKACRASGEIFDVYNPCSIRDGHWGSAIRASDWPQNDGDFCRMSIHWGGIARQTRNGFSVSI